MVTRGECFWVACNRLIIRFFLCLCCSGGGKGGVRRELCMPQVYRPSPISWRAWTYGNSSLPIIYRGAPLHKASNIYLPVLIPSSIWRCQGKSTTFAVTKLAVWFCGLRQCFMWRDLVVLRGNLGCIREQEHQTICRLFWQFRKKHYLCNRKSEEACLVRSSRGGNLETVPL